MHATVHPEPETLAVELAEIIPLRSLRAPELLLDVAARWCERQRFWHGPGHLRAMVRQIAESAAGEEREILLLTALYHDAIYDPRAADNEAESAALLLSHAADPGSRAVQTAADLIVESKWTAAPAAELSRRFFDLDTEQLSNACPLRERLAYETAIFREFQWAPWTVYRERRAEFLEGWAKRFPEQRRGVTECLELLRALQPRVAVYPGSFHPFHLGHLSILRHAEQAFEKVIVAIGVNRQKSGAVESVEERAAELRAQLPFHEVATFTGLLSAFLDSHALPVTVVRGVRNGTDLEAELRFARFLNELRPATSVVWIHCEPEFQHLSSSGIRELEAIEPGSGRRYVPDPSAVYRYCGNPNSNQVKPL